MFDLQITARHDSSVTVSARAYPDDLPAGNYTARAVINPDWNLHFDHIGSTQNQRASFFYMAEANTANNTSASIPLTIDSSVVCNEDGLETARDLQPGATSLLVDQSVEGGLCYDNTDVFSVLLEQGDTTQINIELLTNNPRRPQIGIVTPGGLLTTRQSLLQGTSEIKLTADNAGVYHLVLHGARADYRISRMNPLTTAGEQFYSDDTVAGPVSWLYGSITLNRLAFSNDYLQGRMLSCSRFITRYEAAIATDYVTPAHFSGIHDFQFQADNQYRMDGVTHSDWDTKQGDIISDGWYPNPYFGWAEIIDDQQFRYWEFDGTSYVECHIR